MLSCLKCGVAAEETAKFCTGCGAPLFSPAKTSVPAIQNIFLFVIALLVLILVVQQQGGL